MNLLAPISTIMTTNLVTVAPEDTIKKAEELFTKLKVHHLPVESDGRLVGLISKSDFLYFKRGFNEDAIEDKWDLFRMKTHKVEEIMTTKLAKLEPDEKINVAIEIFKENIFHAIPVVKNDRLMGIVTTLDIIKHLAEDKETIKSYKVKV